jgi:hypothetical protein
VNLTYNPIPRRGHLPLSKSDACEPQGTIIANSGGGTPMSLAHHIVLHHIVLWNKPRLGHRALGKDSA